MAAKAHITDIATIIKNCDHGKKNVIGIYVNKLYCKVIVKPIIVPIRMPSMELDITRIKAS